MNPNTFLQSWEWGQVQQKDGETPRYFALMKGDNYIGAALVITVNAKRGRFLLCPHGPIFSEGTKIEFYLPQFIEYLRELGKKEKAVAIRIAPLLETTPENESLFKMQGFRPAPLHVHAELTWVLDINRNEEEIFQTMRKTTRHAINKGKKEGVKVDIDTSPNGLERFWPLYMTTKTRHQFTPFSQEFFKNQIEEFSKENRMYMAFASYKGKDVAAAIFMHYGDTVFYHHGASTPTNVPAPHALQWASIQEAKKRGATKYNFWGIAPDDQPDHPFAGITIFKKGFGGSAIDYMHAQDLPISPFYWKLWVIEMYRKRKRGF